MARPTIKAVQVGDRTRYRFVVDIGPDPKTGKRRQQTKTYDSKRQAERELSRILNEVNTGAYAGPSKVTLGEYLDEWLRSAVRGKSPNTESAYRHGIAPAKDQLGAVPLQKLTTAHVEDLIDWMLTEGRRRGGKPGTALSPRSAQITLSKLRTALDGAVHRRLVAFNVAAPVKCPAQVKTKRTPWEPAEVRTFLASLADDRLHAPMLLSLIGMRPGGGVRPALGAGRRPRRRDVDDQPRSARSSGPSTTAARLSRRIRRPTPVTERSHCRARSAPRCARSRRLQARERLAAGEAYEPSGYVLVDELGRPFKTDQLRRAAYRLMKAAGVRKVRLYDARHACLTYLSVSGVPGPIISAWAGHADLSMAARVYVHPSPKDLEQGRDALATLLGGGV